jgi:hypothetical protein
MIRIDGATRERLEQILGNRKDASGAVYFQRQLESIEAKLYEIKKPELEYTEYIPVSSRDPAGAETITYRMYDLLGMAKIIANYADDLPRADVLMTEHTQPVKTIATSFGYTVQEIEAGAMTGYPLDEGRATAARRVYREKESSIAWNGDAAFGLVGLLGNANISTIAAPNGAGGTPEWSTKTPAEIIADIATMVSTIRTQSLKIHRGNTLLVPEAQYIILSTTPRSETADTTIMQFIMNNREAYGIERIGSINELDGAGAGGADITMLYELDSDNLEQRIPRPMGNEPVQNRNLEFITPIWGRHGGVVVRYPLAFIVMEDI